MLPARHHVKESNGFELRIEVAQLLASQNTHNSAGASCGECSPEAVRQCLSLWREVTKIPRVKAGWLDSSSRHASVIIEIPDLENGIRRQFEKNVDVTQPSASCSLPPCIQERGAQCLPEELSPSRMRRIRFVALGDSSQASREWKVEVWNSSFLEASVSCGAVHSAPPADEWIQHVAWTADENSVAYAAECCEPPRKKLWEVNHRGGSESKADDSENASHPFFAAKDHWGEKYTDHSNIGLFRLDTLNRRIVPMVSPSFLHSFSCAMPHVVEHGVGRSVVLFVAYPHEPCRLGIAACFSRANSLWMLDLNSTEGTPEPIALFDPSVPRCIRSISVLNGTSKIAFFTTINTRTHNSTFSLYVADIRSREVEEIVGLVQSDNGDPSVFPGLYPQGPHELNWVDSTNLLICSARRSASVIYRVSLRTKMSPVIQQVTHAKGTWKILDCYRSSALLLHSTAIAPPRIYFVSDVQQLTDQSNPTIIFDTGNASRHIRECILPLLRTEVLRFPHLHNSEALLHSVARAAREGEQPEENEMDRTIVFLHGGPHVNDTNSFSHTHFFQLLLGFHILTVNYGGSAGFGERHLVDLCGEIGASDVNDVVSVVKAVGLDDVSRHALFVSGGSHGGFLVSHITCECPSLFVAAAMRNPVTSICSMYGETDIPDWCLVESGSDDKGGVDPVKLHSVSPVSRVSRAETPMLIGIGLKDKRVPSSQGKAWYRELKRRGVRVHLMEYPSDGHALDSVHAEADFAIQMMLFFADCLAKHRTSAEKVSA